MLSDPVVRRGSRRGIQLQDAQPRELILTMLVSFSLSFAILMWERKTALAPPQTLALQAPVDVRSAPISSHPMTVQPRSVERMVAVAAAPPRPSSGAEAAGATEGGALPLAFNVYNRRGRGKIEGFIKNMSGQPLSVSLQVVAASGQPATQMDLNLAPAEQKGFGTDFGLDLHSGDRVILRSPPYQDGSMDVP